MSTEQDPSGTTVPICSRTLVASLRANRWWQYFANKLQEFKQHWIYTQWVSICYSCLVEENKLLDCNTHFTLCSLDLFCMLLLIVAGILFILAILTEWGSGNRTYGPVFMCLGGLLTMVAGAVWLTVMTNTLLSAWILTAGFLIFLIGKCDTNRCCLVMSPFWHMTYMGLAFVGFALFGVIRCCRYCCYYCLTLESEERPPTPYRNTV